MNKRPRTDSASDIFTATRTGGQPPGQMRRSGRARAPTAKAQQLEQEQVSIYGENPEEVESDAMNEAFMGTGHHIENTTNSNEHTAVVSEPASTERTATEPPTQRPTTRNADGDAMQVLTELVRSLVKETKDQRKEIQGQRKEMQDQRKEHESKMEGLLTQIESLQTRVVELTDTINNRPSTIYGPSPANSYANVAASPPNSQPSNIRTITSVGSAGSRTTDTLYCTIDTSRVREESRDRTGLGDIRQAIETKMRTREGHANWRCAAVIRDSKNTKRIKIACRDESELQLVKESAQKALTAECRVLRDQLFPVKVYNTNRTAVLDQEGNLLPGILEALGSENEVSIAKISWRSRKDTNKAYGSMVVYVTKRMEAERLLTEQYFHVAGESAITRVFESRPNLNQCYNCQEIGHKAYSCAKQQTCAKCAQLGHHHTNCQSSIPKCVPCGGPHESYSRNCRVLHLPHHE